VADRHRPDLEKDGIGDGRHGFVFTPSPVLAPGLTYEIVAARLSDGAPIEPCPVLLEPAREPPAPPPADPGAQSAGAQPAAVPPEAPAMGPLDGFLDRFSRTHVDGWAMDAQYPRRRVTLVVTANGAVVGRVLANRYRDDLAAAGLGDGHYGFNLTFPELSPLTAQQLNIKRETDGSELRGCPVMFPAAGRFDADAEQGFATLIAGLESDADERRALDFLVRQADLLLSRRADREAGRAQRQAQSLHRRRWSDPAGPGATPEDGAAAPRALVIDDQAPDAGRDAASVAILSHMRALVALGFEVSFAAGAMADEAAAEALARERITLCGAPFYYTVEDVLKRQESCFDLVYLHRLSNAGRYLTLARAYQPKAKIVYSVADLHHLRVARQGIVEGRPEMATLSRRTEFTEMSAAHLADAVITHSPFEAELLRRTIPARKVHVVPWAVPARPCAVPFADRHPVALIGNFWHAPNQDAAYWLIQSVMPLVWGEDDRIRLLIVGHGWTADRLPGRDGPIDMSRVDMMGPASDLQDIFGRVRLTVAPLRFGAGIKGKVLESLAAGIPCVMSPVAAEGLNLRPAPLEELVADGAEALARTILRFHADEAANQAAAAAGLAMIAEENSERRVVEAMAEIMAGLGADITRS
jgi:glycosyltransferase involved in cell wall biosynthesis